MFRATIVSSGSSWEIHILDCVDSTRPPRVLSLEANETKSLAVAPKLMATPRQSSLPLVAACQASGRPRAWRCQLGGASEVSNANGFACNRSMARRD